MDAVTEVLVARSQQAEAWGRTVLLSLIAHTSLIALVVFLPAGWGAAVHEDKAVMMVSLGGAPGPRQGMNPISERPVQQATPDAPKPNVQAPPALAKPEMIEPLKTARPQPRATAKPDTRKPEPQLHGRTPTTGPQEKEGSALVKTGGQERPFGGLSTGGSNGAGAAYTDVADFCCPEYLATMVQLVQRNWQANQGVDGTVQVKFTVRRDGLINDIVVEQQSTPFLNLAAQRAIVTTKQLPPLPAAFTGDHLTIHLVFQFKR